MVTIIKSFKATLVETFKTSDVLYKLFWLICSWCPKMALAARNSSEISIVIEKTKTIIERAEANLGQLIILWCVVFTFLADPFSKVVVLRQHLFEPEVLHRNQLPLLSFVHQLIQMLEMDLIKSTSKWANGMDEQLRLHLHLHLRIWFTKLERKFFEK